MVHVVLQDNHARHADLVRAMYADRKRVFVDKLRWDLPVLEGRFEIDQFDTPDAVYLIVGDETGNHLGSMRLLPTTRPHLLGEVFAHLCEDGVPTGDDVWEISRLCVSPDLERAATLKVRGRLFFAMVEFAMLYGITTFTGVAHAAWLSQILASGLDVKPLGLPRQSGDDVIGALQIKVSPRTLQAFRKASGRRAPLLRIEQPLVA